MMRSERPDTYEVNSDGGDVALRVGIIGKTEEQARLSNTGVSDEEQLEEIIVSSQTISISIDRYARRGPR